MPVRPIPILPLLLFGLAGCQPGCEGAGASGELGHGGFVYDCAGPNDPFCETDAFGGQPVPDRVAIAAPFELGFESWDGFDDGHLSPASAAVIGGGARRWSFLRGGYGALIAFDASGKALDFLHLEARPTERLHVITARSLSGTAPDQHYVGDPRRTAAMERIPLRPGGSTRLFGIALDRNEVPMAGSLPWSWSVEPSGTVELFGEAGDNVIEVRAVAPGDATLLVQAGEASLQIPVAVEAMP